MNTRARRVLKEFGLPVSRGRAIFYARRGGGRGAGARRAALGGEVADPCRRPRQGQVQGSRGRREGRRAPRQAPSRRSRPSPSEMLGHTLVTIQTGEAGKQVNRLYIEDGSDIESELYLSMLVDRADRPHRLRRLDGRRHGHRESRPRHAGEDPHLLRRSGDRRHAPSRPHSSPRRWASRAPSPRRPRTGHASSMPPSPRRT